MFGWFVRPEADASPTHHLQPTADGKHKPFQSFKPLAPHPSPNLPLHPTPTYIQARQQRNFALSDSIREQLRAAGVEVYDKAKFWKCWDGRVGLIGGFGAVSLRDVL